MDMEEKKSMTKEQLEAELRAMCIKGMIYRILVFCTVVAMIITYVITESLIIALIFLIIAVVFGAQASQATKSSNEIRKLLGKMMTNEQIEAKLKFTLIKATIPRILTWCAVAAVILTLVITKDLIKALGYLVIAIVVGKLSGWATKRSGEIKEILGENVITNVIRDVLGNDVEYNPVGTLAPGGVVVPFSYDHSSGSHHIKTVYTGVNIELGSIKLLYEHRYTQEETGEIVIDDLERFRGPWIICDFGIKPACGVYISEWTKVGRKVMKSNVNIDNGQFGNRFCVRADDPYEAYKILTPQMMEAISAAADKSGGTVYMSFLPNGKMHFAIQTGHDLFELGKGYEDAQGLRQRFSEELRRLTDIIDTLNV